MTVATAPGDGTDRAAVPTALPTPPGTVVRILSVAREPDASINALAPLIEADPTLSASLMGVANSAAYAAGRPPRSVRQASVLLGLRAIRNLAVAHAVRAATARVDAGAFDVQRFWEDSLRRATTASVLARGAGYQDPAEAFTVGLIQDLGSLAMAVQRPDVSAGLQEAADAPAGIRLREERRLTGTSHPEVFARIGAEWGLPDALIQVVANHHGDAAVDDRRGERLRSIVSVADAVADVVQTGGNGDAVRTATAMLGDLQAREPLELEAVLDEVAAGMEAAAGDLRIEIGPQPSYPELMSRAHEALISINSSYEELTRELQEANGRLEEANRQLRVALREKQELARRLETSNETLRQLAAMDTLTGVANRRAFVQILERRLEEAAGSGEPVTLVVLDIDNFKRINDAHGHGTGDDVLRAVCLRMAGALRGADQIARLGGEEFAVVVAGADGDLGRKVAERLRNAIAAEPVRGRDGAFIEITGSFGGVTVQGARLPGHQAVLEAAGRALSASKQRGRDRVTWASGPGGEEPGAV